MACIRVDGYDIPLVFSAENGTRTRVLCHLLHIRFRFLEASIYVEEEKMLDLGEVQQFVPVVSSVGDGMHCWYLNPDNYRSYGLPLFVVAALSFLVNSLIIL